MGNEVDAWFARQDGLITRRQALAAGLTRAMVERRVARGFWVVVRPGVYAEPHVVDTAAALTSTRRLLVDRAASLRIRDPHVASHDFAAYELGLPILHPEREHTHVTRPGIVGSHLRHGVKHHLAPYMEQQVEEIGGRAVLGLARTAVDLAREHGFEAGVVAIDGARRAGVTLGELEDVLGGMRSWPQSTVMRAALDRSDPDADTVPESLARLVVEDLGHGRPQTQFGLTSGGRTVWCDLRLHRHVIEVDGRWKYRPADAGGLALRPVEDVVWDEKTRQDFVCGFQLGMSRVTYPELYGPRRAVLVERLEREYQATCRLFGTSIADLAQYRPRGPRPRPGITPRAA